MMVLVFALPLLLGVAVVMDVRGLGSFFAGSLLRRDDGKLPAVILAVGWFFIAFSAIVLATSLIRLLLSLG